LKSTITLATLLGLMHTGAVSATPALDTSSTMVLDHQLQGAQLKHTELPALDENSMTWPMLPGENLNEVARLFYPKNQYMQRQFVFKTLRLSKDVQPNLTPQLRFQEPTLLLIPTLKSLSSKVRAIRKGPKKPKNQTLNMSYQIEKVPEALVKEYEYLVNKNEFLKQELAKLNEKLIFLQAKLTELKLEFDRTLGSQNVNLPTKQIAKKHAENPPIEDTSAKKVFKNLNKKADEPKVNEKEPFAITQWFDANILLSVLGLGTLFGLGAFIVKKHRETVDAKLSFVASKVQESVAELGGLWQPSSLATVQKSDFKTTQEADVVKASKQAEMNLSSSLEEAKLLMSINRTSDAIAYLKMTIKSSPKSSINHWLYLLDVFRKLKLKDEFENYAKELHATFNVLPPVWSETEVPLAMPKSLQEFPHIMEKLYKTWPEDPAYHYLRGLISDNRGGERIGFGKEVVEEIMMLIGLLEVRKELV
jgi:hypothetical protein